MGPNAAFNETSFSTEFVDLRHSIAYDECPQPRTCIA
jgi:hypothetical protein